MHAILKRIKTKYAIGLPVQFSAGLIPHVLENATDISKLVEDHKWLAIQYSAQCANLMQGLRDEELAKKVDSELLHQIETAYMVAEIMEYIYSQCMSDNEDTDELALMRQHQAEFHKMMKDRDRSFQLDAKKPGFSSYSKVVHDEISAANRKRLFIVRVRRLFITLVPVLTDFDEYCKWVRWAEEMSGPVFSYLAWMTLFPRLIKNLTLLFKHLAFEELWMNKERQLDSNTRLTAQLERHWFELGNDVVTISVGLVNCFILTGAANLYLGISLLAFDVVLASWRAHYELSRLEEIKKSYEEMGIEVDPNFLLYLNKRIEYEHIRHKIAVANTILLLFSTSLTLPILAYSIVIPIIGAALAVLTTIANMLAVQHIEQYKPNDKVVYIAKPLSSLGIFAPENVQNQNMQNNREQDGDEGYGSSMVAEQQYPSHEDLRSLGLS